MFKYIKHILDFSGKYKVRISLAAVPLFLKTMLSQMMIFYSYLMILRLLEKKYLPKDSLVFAGMIVLTLFLEALFQNISDRLQSSAGFIVMAEKRKALGEHLRRMPMGYFSEGNVGNISTVLATDMTYLEEHGVAIVATIISDISNIIVTAIFLSVIDYRIGIVYISFVVLILFLSKGMMKTSLKEASVRQEQNGRLAESVIEFVSGIGVIKSFPAAHFAVERTEGAFRESAEDNIHFEKKYSPWTFLMGIVCGLGITLIFGLGFYLYHTGELDKSFFLGLGLFGMQIFGSVKSFYSQSANVSLAESSLSRVDALLSEPELADTGREHFSPSGEPEIEFRDVSFGYGKEDVLKNVSFTVDKGQMLAFVGPSGGGKSTAVNLIARLWDVREGAVLLRGRDIREVPLGELMNEISMVFQRVYLFKDTIYNNISMGRPDASREEVIEACKKARCHEFIMSLPDGYETVLGEGGASLSGGERQRISIARCILKDSPIILLDEATASVDVDNERYIEEAISELCRDKTVIVIAHRLYTIRDADKILLIKDGKICEQGTNDELVSQEGIFAAMAAV